MPVFATYFALVACASTTPIDEAIMNAWNRNDSIPLAHVIDETLTIERAYRVQTRLVQRALGTERPAGFKAGLTSSGAQSRFRTNTPVAGVLINEPSDTPRVLQLGALRGLHLETEVALRIGKPIRGRLNSVEQLRLHVDGMAAALELPNLDYERVEELEAVDIVSSNVAAAYFLLGEFAPAQHRDANRLAVTLECEGEPLNRGNGRDAMGDQWAAALWLVNTVVDQGWTIEPGQVLLTGALGSMIRAQPGHCVADFGNWGTIEVQIVE